MRQLRLDGLLSRQRSATVKTGTGATAASTTLRVRANLSQVGAVPHAPGQAGRRRVPAGVRARPPDRAGLSLSSRTDGGLCPWARQTHVWRAAWPFYRLRPVGRTSARGDIIRRCGPVPYGSRAAPGRHQEIAKRHPRPGRCKPSAGQQAKLSCRGQTQLPQTGVNRVSKSPDEQAPGPGPSDADRAPFTPRGYYGSPGNPWLPTGPAVPPSKPRPGHDTVLVNDHDDTWMGVWDDPSSDQTEEGGPLVRIEDFEGSKEEVLRWTRSGPLGSSSSFPARRTTTYPCHATRAEPRHGRNGASRPGRHAPFGSLRPYRRATPLPWAWVATAATAPGTRRRPGTAPDLGASGTAGPGPRGRADRLGR
jgi:hypothetical protein